MVLFHTVYGSVPSFFLQYTVLCARFFIQYTVVCASAACLADPLLGLVAQKLGRPVSTVSGVGWHPSYLTDRGSKVVGRAFGLAKVFTRDSVTSREPLTHPPYNYGLFSSLVEYFFYAFFVLFRRLRMVFFFFFLIIIIFGFFFSFSHD